MGLRNYRKNALLVRALSRYAKSHFWVSFAHKDDLGRK